MTDNVFIGIAYDDAYQHVFVEGPGLEIETFATGDPPADLKAAFAAGAARAKEHGVAFMTLSSLDGFVFDVPGWCWNGIGNDELIRDDRDYHEDGRLKTKAEIEAEC